MLREGFVERTNRKHDFASITVPHPGQHRLLERRIRAGDPIGAKVPIVCSDCNSGWMSQIQERAKPYLIPLFRGELTILNPDAQRWVATWACMATIMGEFLSRKIGANAIGQSDRETLMRTQLPPRNWRIWIGKCSQENWPSQWLHVTARVLRNVDGEFFGAAFKRHSDNLARSEGYHPVPEIP